MMTDNEIIKALECCTKGTISDVCIDCPLRTTDICTEEENGVLKLALDLINRQQAEIERLNNNISAMATTLSNSAKEARAEATKGFAERLCEGRVSNDPVVIAVKVELKEMVGDTE